MKQLLDVMKAHAGDIAAVVLALTASGCSTMHTTQGEPVRGLVPYTLSGGDQQHECVKPYANGIVLVDYKL